MLINRIHRSMELVLEGVDSCHPELLLEASKEFESGVQDLIKNIEQFVGICKSFKEISIYVGTLEDFDLAELKKISKEMDKIPEEYSFNDHYKLQTSIDIETGEDVDKDSFDARYALSHIALKYPTYVEALRGTILEIAQWLEQYTDIFSVGKNGIVFSQDFGPYVLNKEIRVKDFANDDGEQVLKAITNEGGDKTEEELKAHFEELWKKEDTAPEKEEEAWTEFKNLFGKIGNAGKAAFDSARKSITDAEPPKVVKKAGNDGGGILKGILGSLLGDSEPEEYKQYNINDNPDYIVGQSLTDEYGIFSMTFVDLQQLIIKVIEFASSVEAVAAKGLAAVDAQNRQTMQPSKQQIKLIEALKDISDKLDQKTIAGIGGVLEKFGMKDGDWSSVDRDKVQPLLQKVLGDEEGDKTKAVLDALFPKDKEEAAGDLEDLKTDLAGLDISDDFNDGLQALLDQMVDSEGNPKEDISAEEAKQEI